MDNEMRFIREGATLPSVDASEAVRRLGGVASYAEVVALASRRKLRTALANGAVIRVSRNRFAMADDDRARRLAVRVDGHLSHLSAARHWNWGVKFVPEQPQLIVKHDHELAGRPAASVSAVVSTTLAGARCSTTRLVEQVAQQPSSRPSGPDHPTELLVAADKVFGAARHRVRRVAAYADGRAAT